MKANLDQTYRWKNKYYGPGENVEIPQELADAAGIKKPAAKTPPPNEDPPKDPPKDPPEDTKTGKDAK